MYMRSINLKLTSSFIYLYIFVLFFAFSLSLSLSVPVHYVLCVRVCVLFFSSHSFLPPSCHVDSVRAKAHVAEAAGMMLQHRVHRLPVVDARNVPIGIATRSDIFEPLISKVQDLISDQDERR